MRQKLFTCVFKFLAIPAGLFLTLLPIQGQTWTVDQVPNDQLKNKYDYVSNPDGILSPQAEQRLNTLIRNVEDSTTAEIAVVLLKSIGDADIDDFSTALFTRWGIGKRQKDNGLLFLLVKDQRQMKFHTGYGLEGVLPDITLSRVMRNEMSPLLAEGNFDQAVLNGMTKVCTYLLNPDAVKEIAVQERDAQQGQWKSTLWQILMVYLVISGLVLGGFLLAFRSNSKIESKEEQYDRLNSNKGCVLFCAFLFPLVMIFFAIVYFMRLKAIRDTPPLCPHCQCAMNKQSPETKAAYLTEAQAKENELKSVDYDVWVCPQCDYHTTFAYDNPHTPYQVCPNCHARTYCLTSDRIVKNATSYSNGQGEKTYQCMNCLKTAIVSYAIPMIVFSSGAGGRSGGGSFGGGGFGGGSWGGGRTGGGGARGGW